MKPAPLDQDRIPIFKSEFWKNTGYVIFFAIAAICVLNLVCDSYITIVFMHVARALIYKFHINEIGVHIKKHLFWVAYYVVKLNKKIYVNFCRLLIYLKIANGLEMMIFVNL